MPVLKRKNRPLRQVVRKLRCMIRRRFLSQTTFLTVTGSCGKTTTAWFLGKILSDHGGCFTGVHNNCENAVMRNIRDARRNLRFFVQEVGVEAPGSMKKVLPLLRPHIGIVTTIGQDHYRSFRTLEATAAEKGELIESLPLTGVAVLNADDPYVLGMASRTKARVITYGVSETADVRATDIRFKWPQRLAMTVSYQGESCRLETGLFGDLLITSVLAAIAGALAAGVEFKQCADSLQGIETFPRRMSIHRTPAGVWFISDTCKAPFWSVPKAVSLLADVTAPRKTMVFGTFSDMPGSDSDKYRRMAREALEIADRVIFTGSKSVYIRKMLTPDVQGRLFAIESIQSVARLLSEDVVKDELVYIKSGNRDHLERLIIGQTSELKCREQSCTRMMSCDLCENSGLMPKN